MKEVYLLTKQLVLETTATTPITVGVFDSFYKATKNISSKWIIIGEAQWGFRHDNIHYIVTKHLLQ